jgi:hypothetical protein
MMPEVDGLEVLKYVRANEVHRDLPVVSEWRRAVPPPRPCPGSLAGRDSPSPLARVMKPTIAGPAPQ